MNDETILSTSSDLHARIEACRSELRRQLTLLDGACPASPSPVVISAIEPQISSEEDQAASIAEEEEEASNTTESSSIKFSSLQAPQESRTVWNDGVSHVIECELHEDRTDGDDAGHRRRMSTVLGSQDCVQEKLLSAKRETLSVVSQEYQRLIASIELLFDELLEEGHSGEVSESNTVRADALLGTASLPSLHGASPLLRHCKDSSQRIVEVKGSSDDSVDPTGRMSLPSTRSTMPGGAVIDDALAFGSPVTGITIHNRHAQGLEIDRYHDGALYFKNIQEHEVANTKPAVLGSSTDGGYMSKEEDKGFHVRMAGGDLVGRRKIRSEKLHCTLGTVEVPVAEHRFVWSHDGAATVSTSLSQHLIGVGDFSVGAKKMYESNVKSRTGSRHTGRMDSVNLSAKRLQLKTSTPIQRRSVDGIDGWQEYTKGAVLTPRADVSRAPGSVSPQIEALKQSVDSLSKRINHKRERMTKIVGTDESSRVIHSARADNRNSFWF